jgi:hypothetical protein
MNHSAAGGAWSRLVRVRVRVCWSVATRGCPVQTRRPALRCPLRLRVSGQELPGSKQPMPQGGVRRVERGREYERE